MNIFEKLQKCRIDLQEMELRKTGKNNFSGFTYFNLGDFLPAVNKLFEKYGLFSNFSITNDNMAMLTIIDTADVENKITFTSPIAELDLKGCNKIQALGGVHTYLKRYLYMNALEIVENDLFDVMSGKAKTAKAKTTTTKTLATNSSYISMKQKNELKDKLGGVEFAKIMNTNNGKISVQKFVELMGEQ